MIDLFAQDLVGFLGGGVLLCAIFATGAFLQVKIIASLRRDQLMAWDIDLAHSIVMIATFSSILILESISYVDPTSYDIFGQWFCYSLLSLWKFGGLEMAFHSLYISFYKYIFIIHSETVNLIGKSKVKKLLLSTYFIFLISWTVSYAVRPVSNSFGYTITCSVPSETSGIMDNQQIIEKWTSHLFSCSIKDLDQKNSVNIVVNVITKILCTSQTIITVLITLNVLEIFFYLSIFRHMRR